MTNIDCNKLHVCMCVLDITTCCICVLGLNNIWLKCNVGFSMLHVYVRLKRQPVMCVVDLRGTWPRCRRPMLTWHLRWRHLVVESRIICTVYKACLHRRPSCRLRTPNSLARSVTTTSSAAALYLAHLIEICLSEYFNCQTWLKFCSHEWNFCSAGYIISKEWFGKMIWCHD